MMGTTKSKTSRSFEKRVKMRPIGFWSKNRMLALKTPFVTASCRFVTLFSMTLKNASERNRVKIKKARIRTQKTIGYSFSCYSSL